jgi:hypothetical protein
MPSVAQADLQGSQLASDRRTKETVIAHLHKSLREHMLKETLEELLDRKGTLFELTCIGSTILKRDLRSFHTAAIFKRQQTTIADGDPMDIRSQILEGSLAITHRLAMHNPFLLPDLRGDVVKEFQFLQTASEGRPK